MSKPPRTAVRPAGPMPVYDVAALFKLLGDPSRLSLLDLLGHGERCVSSLAAAAGMSESATSHQLRLLRTAHLVRVRRDGRRAFYVLEDAHVARLIKDAVAHTGERR